MSLKPTALSVMTALPGFMASVNSMALTSTVSGPSLTREIKTTAAMGSVIWAKTAVRVLQIVRA
jgi:hypothetical protein